MNHLWENYFRKKPKNQDVLSVLKQSHLFQDLSEREISFVQNIVHLRKYHPGEIIFRQGELGVGMYILIKGRVELYVSDDHSASEDSQDIFITQLSDGDFFGELSLVEENGRRTATAVAREECSLIGFFKPDLLEILSRSPSLGVKIVFRLAEILGKRLKETTLRVSELRRLIKDLKAPPPLENENV